MANQVEIFNIEFGDTIESIAKLKAELKETRKLFEQAKPSTQEYVKYGAEVKRLESTVKTLNGITKEQTNALGGINTAAKFASGSYGELKSKIKETEKSLLELNVDSKEFADTQKELIQLQYQRIDIEKKIPSLFQERIKGAIDESNALKQLRVDLKAAQAAALNGDGEAAKRVGELKEKMDDLREGAKTLQGSGVERLNASMALLTEGFANFHAGKVSTGFKGIGAAMSAIPIVLIIEGIKALIDNFDKVVDFVTQFTGGIGATKLAVKELTTAIENQSIVNEALIASYNDEIALLVAKGGHEKEIIKIKRELIGVQILEAEAQVQTNALKLLEKKADEGLIDSAKEYLAYIFQISGATKKAKDLRKEVAKSREADTAEEKKAFAESIKNLKTTKNSLLVLNAESNKTDIENAKKQNKLLQDLQVEAINDNEKREIAKANLDNEREKELIKKEITNKDKRDSALIFQKSIFEKKIKEITDKYSKERADKEKESAEKHDKYLENIYQAELKAKEDLQKLEQDFINQSFADDVTIANTKLINARLEGENLLNQQLELLHAQEAQELEAAEGNEVKKAEIKAKYRELNLQAELDNIHKQWDAAINLTAGLAALTDSLFAAKRATLEKGSKEDRDVAENQFKIAKALNLTLVTMSGIEAVQSYIKLNPPTILGVPNPLAIAGLIGITAFQLANVAKVASTQFQYKEGGYTGEGNPSEVSTNLGSKDYTYHKDEYVVPSRVLNTPKGSLLAMQLESMRKGITNPMPNISGMFDGGFTTRSASASVESSASTQNNIRELIMSMPTPVVKVTDINKVSQSNQQSINVSSL